MTIGVLFQKELKGNVFFSAYFLPKNFLFDLGVKG
jgi:hypothetical protein